MKRLALVLIGTALLLSAASAFAQVPSYEYTVKFVCGRADAKMPVVAPGMYFTAINVQNPNEKPTEMRKMIAVAFPGEKPGPVSKPFGAKLGPDQAFEIDCPDIMEHLKGLEVPREFVKGFVILRSPVELNVVAVYTAADDSKQVRALEVERVPARRLSALKPQ